MEGEYELELKIQSREDRKTVMAILADNGYDVGQHKRRTGAKAVAYYVHAVLQDTNVSTSGDR